MNLWLRFAHFAAPGTPLASVRYAPVRRLHCHLTPLAPRPSPPPDSLTTDHWLLTTLSCSPSPQPPGATRRPPLPPDSLATVAVRRGAWSLARAALAPSLWLRFRPGGSGTDDSTSSGDELCVDSGLASFCTFSPSARELVRDERQDAQDRRLISRAIPLRGSGSPCPSDKKARTMDPHRTGMEIHHACHRRPSDYHQPRPRPQGRSGLLAAAVAGDVPARAVPGRAPPRPDRGVRPSGRPSDPAPALPSPHREGRPGAGPAEPPRQSRRWYAAPGDAAVHLQDDLRRGHRPAVADQPQARRHHRGPLGQGLGDIPPTAHHPEPPGCGL